jgi:hypothetical protein
MIRYSSLWGRGGRARFLLLLVVAVALAVAFGASWNECPAAVPF